MLQQPVVSSFKNNLLTLAWPSATLYEYPEEILYSIELLNAALFPEKWMKIASAYCIEDGSNYLFADILFYLQGTFRFRVQGCYKNGITISSKPSALFDFKAGNKPPKFCQNLKPIVINAGESLSISAKIEGEPTPKISWNLRNNPIMPSKYVSIENTPYYTRLVCFNVRQSHSGIYEIKAVNEHGIDTTCVEVTVIEKLTVWCALWAGGIIGPYFFKNDEGHNVTVNGDRYRAMITNFFIPELNNHDVQELWFQQDGATCHTARATIDLLKDTFGDRLSSRFGPVN
ncbi:hypothetical protein TNCV_340521 [Trichonephila clavipes]|nr:hypothetical protein TNCV_340521 [Trichonephila clavipes]